MKPRNDETVLNVPAPILRFIPIDALHAHEEHDPQRSTPLVKRIAEADVWLHPPIVAPLEGSDSEYVVLDGANRCFSVQQLGYPHILVQVVTYDSGQVMLDTWNHVLTNANTKTILETMAQISHVDMRASDLLEAQAELAQRDAIVYIIDFDDNQKVYMLSSDERTMRARTENLRTIVNCYKDASKLDRINTADAEQTLLQYPEANALVVFPHYEPPEIMYAARERILLPPGISRHIIEGRAMRLLYPIETLKDTQQTLEQKNANLQNWVQQQIDKRAVRFYAESTYMFDD